jgi:hypothetical protein
LINEKNKLNMIFAIAALYISQICFGQQPTYTPDLSAVMTAQNGKILIEMSGLVV